MKLKRIFNQFLAISSLVSVCLLWKHNWILFGVLGVIAVLMLLINKSKREIKTFFFCAIAGTITEIVAIMSGAWFYMNVNLYNIPVWLPVLWGIASIYMVRVYLSLK